MPAGDPPRWVSHGRTPYEIQRLAVCNFRRVARLLGTDGPLRVIDTLTFTTLATVVVLVDMMSHKPSGSQGGISRPVRRTIDRRIMLSPTHPYGLRATFSNRLIKRSRLRRDRRLIQNRPLS